MVYRVRDTEFEVFLPSSQPTFLAVPLKSVTLPRFGLFQQKVLGRAALEQLVVDWMFSLLFVLERRQILIMLLFVLSLSLLAASSWFPNSSAM